MNGWKLQPSPMKRKENDLNQTSMIVFHVNLQGCNVGDFLQQKHCKPAVRIVNEDLRDVLHFLVQKSAKLCPNNYSVVVVPFFSPEDLVVVLFTLVFTNSCVRQSDQLL